MFRFLGITMDTFFKRALVAVKKVYACYKIRRCGVWFVDIPRTSSSSVRAELGKHFGFPYGKINIMEKQHAGSQMFPDHMLAKDMRAILGENTWNKIFTFTIIRNPWERVYSLYKYRQKVGNISNDINFTDYIINLQNAFNSKEFSDTLFSYPPHRYAAADYLLDDQGDIIVDYIIRFENRDQDLKIVLKKLDYIKLGQLRVQSSSTKSTHYSYYYNHYTRKIIEEIYAKDIKLYNYCFENIKS